MHRIPSASLLTPPEPSDQQMTSHDHRAAAVSEPPCTVWDPGSEQWVEVLGLMWPCVHSAKENRFTLTQGNTDIEKGLGR